MAIIDQLFEKVRTSSSQMVYITGRSCTGKTTLSLKLSADLDYYQLELDSVITNIPAKPGIKKYYEIYRTRHEPELIAEFIQKTSDIVLDSIRKYSGVVLEGAVTNSETLNELFDSLPARPLFVYLLPTDKDLFKERVLKRFYNSSPTNTNSLNQEFWQTTSADLVAEFYKTGKLSVKLDNEISAYISLSMEEAEERLSNFKTEFSDIEIVDV